MKKFTVAIITIVSLSLIFVSGAFANGFNGPRHQGPPKGPADLIGKAIHDTMLEEVVYELTGETLEAPEPPAEDEDTAVRPLRDPKVNIAEKYGIDEDTLKAAMNEKIIDWVSKALECELLTQDQVDHIAEVMSQGPPAMTTEE